MNTFRILGLTALTLLSIVPLAKPLPPTLHTQAFTREIPLTATNLSGCGSELFTALFQENVTGRDIGSTTIFFVSAVFLGVTAYSNVSAASLESSICSGTTNLLVGSLVGAGSEITIRPLVSGNYTLSNQSGYDFSPLPHQYRIYETWTVTTIS